MNRVIVTGGRTYLNRRKVFDTLDGIGQVEVLIHGGAVGLDTLAGLWAEERNVPVDVYPALWDDVDVPGAVKRWHRGRRCWYNQAAGFQRNERMVRLSCPTLALVFPGGAGTYDCAQRLRRAQRAGQAVEIREVYDG